MIMHVIAASIRFAWAAWPTCAGVICLILASGQAQAQYIKQDTTGLLGSSDWSPSWSTTVTTGTMTFDNTLSASTAANLSVAGTGTFGKLVFSGTTGPVVISSGTISLSAVNTAIGIEVLSTASDVTINSSFTNNSSTVELNVGTGRTLTLAGGGRVTRSGGAGTVAYTTGAYGSVGAVSWNSGSTATETGGVRVGDSATITIGGVFGNNGFTKINGTNASVSLTSAGNQKAIGNAAASNGKVQLVSGTLAVSGTGLLIGLLNGQGSLDIQGGTFTHSGTTMRIVSQATSGAASGALQISAGTASIREIQFGGGSSTSGTGTLAVSGGRLELGAGGMTNAGSGSFAHNITLAGGTMGAAASWSSDLALKLGGNVTFDTEKSGTAYVITLSGTLSNNGVAAGGFTKTGAGTLTLSSGNTYTGTTTLNAGTLVAGAANAFGGSTAPLVINAGTASLGGFSVAVGPLSGSSGGVLSTSNAAGTATFTTNVASGTSTFAGAIADNGSGVVALTKQGGGRLTFSGNNTYSGATQINAGILAIAPGGSIGSTSGVTLSGSTAELKYNAAAALTRPITLTQGIISGTGTIGSAVTFASGDILSPGNSPGTQAYTSLHAWSPGGTYQWELNALTGAAGTNWDLVNVTSGTFDLSALDTGAGSRFVLDLVTLNALDVAGPLANPFDGGSYTFAIASYNPSNFLLPAGFSNTAGADLTGLFQINLGNWQGTKPQQADISVKINSTATGIDLVIVPEPAAFALAGIGIAVAAWSRRRRCFSVKSFFLTQKAHSFPVMPR
jgi:fibronectin-binding autotransporter adhesin